MSVISYQIGANDSAPVPGVSDFTRKPLTISSNGQTSFSLDTAPAQPTELFLFLNGLKQWTGIDYTISGMTITWLGITLQTTDSLEAVYQ